MARGGEIYRDRVLLIAERYTFILHLRRAAYNPQNWSCILTPLDHSYLNRFEIWLFRNCPRLFFDEVIRLIDQLCPEDRERIELVDTSGVHARAAKTYLTELIRTVCAKILHLLAQTLSLIHI